MSEVFGTWWAAYGGPIIGGMEKVIAGVGHTAQSLAAAEYAAALALRRHARLHLIHVFDSVFHGFGPLPAPNAYPINDPPLRPDADEYLADVVGRLRSAHPGLEITAQVREGDVSQLFINASAGAAVTVIGSEPDRGVRGPRPGSVPARVAAHGHGAVVVVHPGGLPHGPVLVGVDGSRPAIAAVRYAVREALALRVPLVAMNVYADGAADAKELLRETLQPWQDAHPQLEVVWRLVHSPSPEYAMAEESRHAGLTVVGSLGHGGSAALLLGSVSQLLVRDGVGPVAIVHAK